MTNSKLQVYRECAQRLIDIFEEKPDDHMHAGYCLRSWVNFIERLAAGTQALPPLALGPCWLNDFAYESTTSTATGKSQYKVLKFGRIHPSSFSNRELLQRLKQAPNAAAVPKTNSKKNPDGKSNFESVHSATPKSAHRLICLLWSPSGKLAWEASHLCGNGGCCSPYHLVDEAGDYNKSRRNCTNGCHQLCPHYPKCIWVDKTTGKQRPCRNLQFLPHSCDCDKNCFGQ